MIILPHLYLMHRIQTTFTRLSKNTDEVFCLLSNYIFHPFVSQIYGAKYIDQAIKWIQDNEGKINYCLGYRLDTAKIPSISVMFEGGTESRQFIGDYGSDQHVSIHPVEYANVTATKVNEDGSVFFEDETKLSDKIWRGLLAINEKKGYIVKDIIRRDWGTTVYFDSKVEPTQNLLEWKFYSSANTELWTTGTSLDRVTINVYVDVAGDPELCELLSQIVRYILKQSRLSLISNGLNEISFKYSPIQKNNSMEQNVWTSQHTVTGDLTDQWLMGREQITDRIELLNNCHEEIYNGSQG